MTCRKKIMRRLRCEGMVFRHQVCGGTVDDDGRCRACGGVYGKRWKKPVERIQR